jgi:thiol-disulfide isomerase/thioredoxin
MFRMTRWGLLLAAASVLWAQDSAQDSIDRLETSKKLLERDPAGALDYATKAAALDSETERWFWPVILEAQLKLGRWEAAAATGAKSVADIEAARMFTRIYQTADEIKLRQLYATALDRCGKPEEAKAQRFIAELLSSPNEIHSGDSRAQAIVAAEQASRVKYAKSDLLATEGKELARLFSVYDLDGRVADLHGQKGKIVIALFWATWCGPCIKELDALNRIYAQLRDRAEVMAVDIDDKPDVIRKFVKNRDLAFSILTTLGAEASSYTAGATLEDADIPQLYVIDRAGNIRFHLRGFDDDGLFEQRVGWMMAALR